MTQQSAAVTEVTSIATVDKTIEYQAFGSAEKVKLSIAIVKNWLVAPTASGKLPTDSDIMKFMMLCKARQLNPWEGDSFLVGYDSQKGPQFSLITAHQAFLKRAEVHGHYDGMQSGVILQDASGALVDLEGDFVPSGYTLLGGWCKVYRKDQTYPKIARLNVEIFDKGFAQWKSNKPGMIVKCAESDALRGAFPNTLGGLYSEAEMSLIQHDSDGNGNGGSLADKTKQKVEEMKARYTPDEVTPDVEAEPIEAEIVVEPEQAGDDVEPPQDDLPETDDEAADEMDELESLRANVQAKFDELPKMRQKDLLAGKPSIAKSDQDELLALLAAMEG